MEIFHINFGYIPNFVYLNDKNIEMSTRVHSRGHKKS